MQSLQTLFSTGHLISIGLMTKEVHQNCEIHSPLVGTLVFEWGFKDHIVKMHEFNSKEIIQCTSRQW